MAVDPLNAPAYRRLAEISPLVGKPKQARWAALQLVGLSPDDPENWRFLADQYHSAKSFRTASLMFQKAQHISALAQAKSRPNSIH